jgi:hypothetical protein
VIPSALEIAWASSVVSSFHPCMTTTCTETSPKAMLSYRGTKKPIL